MMKESQPSYRLHKRGVQGCCGDDEDHAGVQDKDDGLDNLNFMAKRLRTKLSGDSHSQGNKYFPGLNRFHPAYYDWVGLMDQVGK